MSLTKYAQVVSAVFLDALFPIRCVVCQDFGRWLCRRCSAEVKVHTQFHCLGCNRNTYRGEVCPNCQNQWALDGAWVVAAYHDPIVRRLLKQLKYRYLTGLVEPLAELAKGFLVTHHKPLLLDVMIPVPLARRRELSRGFNQAELLANSLVETIGCRVAAHALRRTKNTRRQSYVADHRRHQNVSGAFQMNTACDIKGKRVLLVDDIATSGQTLNECARVLKRAGAVQVWALVWARG